MQKRMLSITMKSLTYPKGSRSNSFSLTAETANVSTQARVIVDTNVTPQANILMVKTGL